MQNDSDAEDVPHLPVCGRPWSQQTLSGAGRALRDVALSVELNRAMTDDPRNPSSSKGDFNLASGLVKEQCSQVAD